MNAIAAGMESSDDSDLDDIGFPEPSPSHKTSKKYEKYYEIDKSTATTHNRPHVNHSDEKLQHASSSKYSNHRVRSNGPSNYRVRRNPRQCFDSSSSELLDDLRYAITTGNLETTKRIISKGIYVDTILKAGWTGLMYASSSGHSNIVSYLLENKADANYHKDMYTSLIAVCASRKNEEDLLKCCNLLIKYGANVNAHERHMTTSLMFASREGYYNIVKVLLDHDANPNLQDNRGKTAIAWAASAGHGHIIRLLIEKGGDPTICDRMGQSPEDYAYENGHSELVSMFQRGNFSVQNSEVKESPNRQLKANGTLGKSKLDVEKKKFTKVGELELFLSGIGYSNLVKNFQEHDLNFNDILIMDDGELEKIGINQVGARKTILEACKSIHKKEWENSSLPNLKHSQYISCPDAVAMMANIAKHLKFISSSVIYIRQQIQCQPRILELAQDSANVHDLIDEMEDSLKNVRFLQDEMRFLKLYLQTVQDKHQYIPADLIVETVPLNNDKRKIVYTTVCLVATAAIVIGIFWKSSSSFSSIPTAIRLKLPNLSFSL